MSLRALNDLSARVHALKMIPAARDTSVRIGHRTLALVRRLYPDAVSNLEVQPAHHAVVIGAVGRRLDVDLTPLLIAFAQSLAAGTLGAATRCMPVSPAQAQRLLVENHDLDIRAHQQAFLHTRLFQS